MKGAQRRPGVKKKFQKTLIFAPDIIVQPRKHTFKIGSCFCGLAHCVHNIIQILVCINFHYILKIFTCTFQAHGQQFLVYFAMLLVLYFRTKLVQNLRKIIVRALNVLIQENLVLRQYHSIGAIFCKPIKIN